jgi:hypothetical protein
MLDFTPVRNKEISLSELVAALTPGDLGGLTEEMVASMESLIADCVDADVTFTPLDPQAYDSFTSIEAEVHLPWNLGHVIGHTTASAEESAALAAELARGVLFHGRSRYETPWRSIATLAACHQRLAESRRMRLASLEMWPAQPHLENTYEPRPGIAPINAIGRFVLGLMHDDSHLGQIAEIVRQARAVRSA